MGRRNVRRLLKKYRRSLLADDRSAFCLARREYKHLLKKRKKKDFYDALLDKLISSVKNQKDFWESVHKISPKRKTFYNNISLDSCFKHFRTLLEKEVDFYFDDENAAQDKDSFLNLPISKKEVMLAFRKLKNKKAAGPDRIIGEMLKNSGTHVIDFFVKILMLCLRKDFLQLNGLNLSYFLCLRKAMLIIRIITEASRYVMQAAKFTVQLLTLDCKSGLK